MNRNIEELILQELRELKKGVNSLCTRMDALEARMDALEVRMDAIEARMDAIENRMDAIEARMDAIEARMDAIESRMDAIESRMDKVEESIEQIRCACNTFLEWADNAYENMHRFPRVGGVGLGNAKGRTGRETRAQYYVAVKS